METTLSKQYDAWGTDDGLLDDYDLQVEAAWFGPDEENDDDRIFLFLQGPAFVDGEEVDEEHRDRFSCGKGWEVVEEGEGVEHGSGRNKFHSAAGVGRLARATVGLGDDEAELLGERGVPWEAKVWQGLTFHMVRREFSFKDSDGEVQEYRVPLPTAVSVTEKKKAKKKAAKKKAPAKNSGGAKGEKALKRKLVKLAGDFDDFEEYVDAALDEYPEVEDYDDLHAELLDEDGLFAEGQ